MHNKITSKDRRVLEIANRYVLSHIMPKKLDIDPRPIDWRTYHNAAGTALIQYRGKK